MILGIGIDLCRVVRIQRSIKRLGDDWIAEVFTPGERELCERGIDPVLLFARGFCGKEACFKALGTGRIASIDWHDVEVLQTAHSTSLRLTGGADQQLRYLTPAGCSSVLHVTCSSQGEVVQALVIISAVAP